MSVTRMSLASRLRPLLFWSPTVFVLAKWLDNVKTISGPSMQPTLNPNTSLSKDIALFNPVSAWNKEYGRGDIVTIRSPENPKRVLIKRILAIEGDTVKTLPPYAQQEVVIPEGHIWIEGDEPFFSDDSNRFGPVSASLVESKLVILLWPPDRFGRLNDVRRDAKSARVVSSFAKSVDELQATRSPDAH